MHALLSLFCMAACHRKVPCKQKTWALHFLRTHMRPVSSPMGSCCIPLMAVAHLSRSSTARTAHGGARSSIRHALAAQAELAEALVQDEWPDEAEAAAARAAAREAATPVPERVWALQNVGSTLALQGPRELARARQLLERAVLLKAEWVGKARHPGAPPLDACLPPGVVCTAQLHGSACVLQTHSVPRAWPHALCLCAQDNRGAAHSCNSPMISMSLLSQCARACSQPLCRPQVCLGSWRRWQRCWTGRPTGKAMRWACEHACWPSSETSLSGTSSKVRRILPIAWGADDPDREVCALGVGPRVVADD